MIMMRLTRVEVRETPPPLPPVAPPRATREEPQPAVAGLPHLAPPPPPPPEGVAGQSLRGAGGGGSCSLSLSIRTGRRGTPDPAEAHAAAGCVPGVGCELGAAWARRVVLVVVQAVAAARGGWWGLPPVWIRA